MFIWLSQDSVSKVLPKVVCSRKIPSNIEDLDVATLNLHEVLRKHHLILPLRGISEGVLAPIYVALENFDCRIVYRIVKIFLTRWFGPIQSSPVSWAIFVADVGRIFLSFLFFKEVIRCKAN